MKKVSQIISMGYFLENTIGINQPKKKNNNENKYTLIVSGYKITHLTHLSILYLIDHQSKNVNE